MLKAKQFLHIDFLAAAGAAGYAVAVSSFDALAHLAEVIASPEAAIAFAGMALGRWALGIRSGGKADDAS